MVGVTGEDDPRSDRDVLRRQPVGIAAAVPALVLVAHDARNVSEPRDGAQDALPDHRVVAHQPPLLLGQCAGLVEDLVRHGHLADVVQEGRGLDLGGGRVVEPHVARHRAGQRDHVLGVLAGVAVALEQGHGERRHCVAPVRVRGRLAVGGPGAHASAALFARALETPRRPPSAAGHRSACGRTRPRRWRPGSTRAHPRSCSPVRPGHAACSPPRPPDRSPGAGSRTRRLRCDRRGRATASRR